MAGCCVKWSALGFTLEMIGRPQKTIFELFFYATVGSRVFNSLRPESGVNECNRDFRESYD